MSAEPSRIVPLDQFRGYTVLGMFLVNFVGSFVAVKATLPLLSHHHTYCSYADTIMPGFLFAVGFAYRLTFLRRRERDGAQAAYAHALTRSMGLLLVGFVVHHLDGKYETWAKLQELGPVGVLERAFQRNFFQTLTHIGVTSIWVLPVIAAHPTWRILHAIASGALYHLLSELGYYEWVMGRPGIDGGPLGFLSWTIPLIAGSLAFDLTVARERPTFALLGLGIVIALFGYALSCLGRLTPPHQLSLADWKAVLVEPPFIAPAGSANIWTMSQRAGSISYTTFGAGFSLMLYALFVRACEAELLPLGVFRTLGSNALAGYILHDLVDNAVKPFVPKDSPLWYVAVGVGVYLAICYACLLYLEKRGVFLKL